MHSLIMVECRMLLPSLERHTNHDSGRHAWD
jgi:hypothetical protein